MKILLIILLFVAPVTRAASFFASASSEYGTAITNPRMTAAYPQTIMCKVYLVATNTLGAFVTANSLTTARNGLYSDGSGALVIVSSDGSSATTFIGMVAAGISLQEWFHCAGVFASASSRDLYINGVLANSNGTLRNQSAHAVILAAARILSGTTGGFLNGALCEYAVWQAALPAEEIKRLADGVMSPLNAAFPDKQMHYLPMLDGLTTHTHDYFMPSMSYSNTPSAIVHPKIASFP